MKKLLFIALVFFVSTLFMQQTVYGEETVTKDTKNIEGSPQRDFKYYLNLSDGTKLEAQAYIMNKASIDTPGEINLRIYTSYLDTNPRTDFSGTVISIPETIEKDNYQFIVKKIGWFGGGFNFNINLPLQLETIDQSSFSDIKNLSISIPASVTSIEKQCFTNTTISKLQVDGKNPDYFAEKNCLYSKDGKIAYYIDTSSTSVIKVKDGVTIIKENSLYNNEPSTNIQELIIPASVKSIEQDILEIPYLEFLGKTPPKFKSRFSGNYFKTYDNYILVPKGSTKKYTDVKYNNGGTVFYSWKIYEKNEYIKSTQQYLKKMGNSSSLKTGLKKPKGITNKQWDVFKKKAAQITSGAESDKEKAFKIYDWITTNFTYDYTAVGNSKLKNGITQYLMIPRAKYDLKLNYTYTAYKNQKAIQYGFVNVTNVLMRAAGLPSYTFLGERTNQAWGTHFSSYRNMVYYDKSWHIVDSGRGCINYIDDYNEGKRDSNYINSFDITWKAWSLQEQDIPMVIEDVIPILPTDKAAYSSH